MGFVVTSANWKVHVFTESFIRTVFCLDVVIGFQIFRVGPRQRLFVSLVGPSIKTEKTRSDGDQKHRQNKETTRKHMYMYNKTTEPTKQYWIGYLLHLLT